MSVEQTKMTAPKLHHYLDWLGGIEYRNFNDDTTYDEKSLRILDQFFSEVEQIQPTIRRGDRFWNFWFRADRGPIEDFGDYEEYRRDGDVKNHEEFEAIWKDFYPNEEEWYEITAAVSGDLDYRCIYVRHEFVIELDSRKPHENYPHDISDFCEWLLESLREVIAQLKEGTYNELIESRVPAENRVGRIVREELWRIFPEDKEEFFKDLTTEEVEEAIRLMEAQGSDREFTDRLPQMTANDFYRFCALGYAANNYKGTDLPLRKQYDLHADGRDEGLGEIDPDSAQAFHDWLKDTTHMGGHPWEVCRGGNSTHIGLHAVEDEKGYYLYLAGSSVGRCVEAIKFYLALKREGIPVYLTDAQELADRLKGKEIIGIVPDGIIPRYCSSWFPDEDIIAYMNLPYECRDEVTAAAKWEHLDPVYLADSAGSKE